MRILVLSDTPWADSNSFGNSVSNIFEGIDNIEVANIACRPGRPTSYLVKRYYQLSERSLLKNLKNKAHPSGAELDLTVQPEEAPADTNLKARSFGQKRRWQILFWARDMIWRLGRWNSPQLREFVDSFQPDIIFQPVYYSSYLNRIALFLKQYTGKPMLGYISDDCYTLRQFSLSPLYWIDRLLKRRYVKKTIEQCRILYVISDVQKREYEKLFTPPCKVLTKCAEFADTNKPACRQPGSVLKMVYAGNVSRGRYEILAEIAGAVKTLESAGIQYQLDIYTLTPMTEKQKAVLSGEHIAVHPPVSYAEIRKIQQDADILIHAEGFSLKERLAVHQSFSTKIVDYLETNRCVLAVGSDDCASIQYFMKNGCGAVATSKEKIAQLLRQLAEDKAQLQVYAEKAWQCGKTNHQKAQMQKMIWQDLCDTLENTQKGGI